MSFYLTNTEELSSVADAIRSATGSDIFLPYPQGFIDALIGGGGLPPEYQAVDYIETDGVLILRSWCFF